MKKIIAVLLMIALLICSASFAESDFEPIAKGAKGNNVVEIQTYLKEQGYLSSKADGDFGGGTEKAVKAFALGRTGEPICWQTVPLKAIFLKSKA